MLSNNLIKRDTTGAFALIDSLVRHEVKHIFGYPGGCLAVLNTRDMRTLANYCGKILVKRDLVKLFTHEFA